MRLLKLTNLNERVFDSIDIIWSLWLMDDIIDWLILLIGKVDLVVFIKERGSDTFVTKVWLYFSRKDNLFVSFTAITVTFQSFTLKPFQTHYSPLFYTFPQLIFGTSLKYWFLMGYISVYIS